MRIKMFPVLSEYNRTEVLQYVPYDIFESHRKQIDDNHSQSLETLASRGGLGIEEMAAILNDVSYFKAKYTYAFALKIVFDRIVKYYEDVPACKIVEA